MKRILPLVLLIAILATACGKSATSSYMKYWEKWINNIPDGQFEKADSESFVLEQGGFSVEFTVDKWVGTRGTGGYVLHPAGNQVIREQKTSDCVIPFVITTTTTTKDSSFMTDYTFSVASLDRYRDMTNAMSDESYIAAWNALTRFGNNVQISTCNMSMFEAEQKRNEEYLEGLDKRAKSDDRLIEDLVSRSVLVPWYSYGGGRFSETKTGDTQTVLGYYVIPDYYSPDFPNGNVDMLPEIGAMLWVEAYISSDRQMEIFPVTLLAK